MSDGLGTNVCVIGAGALGLAAVKNLLEQSFTVTAYERSSSVGGLWRTSSNSTQTTALEGTISNISKIGGCYTDFPYSDDTSLHPDAAEVQAYLEAYAQKFDLWRHIKLSHAVVTIERTDDRKWLVTTRRTEPTDAEPTHSTAFDRLIVATGAESVPIMPSIPNLRLFAGKIIHSQQFKDASKYAGKDIIVVGSGQTAADTAEFLRRAGAGRIYMSHRRMCLLLSRILQGKPVESMLSRRFCIANDQAKAHDASAVDKAAHDMFTNLRKATWPALNGHAAFSEDRALPLPGASVPIISDTLADNLASGRVESVQAIDSVLSGDSVALKDGSVIAGIDAIIFCTGNRHDFSSLLPIGFDPSNTKLAPRLFDKLRATKHYREDLAVCHTYRRFLSMQDPHALAFLGAVVSKVTPGGFPFYDLVTMALAQLWKGASKMPTKAEMDAEVAAYFSSTAKMLEQGEIGGKSFVDTLEYDDWLQNTAGTGVPAKLGSGGKEDGDLHLQDSKLYAMLMDGIGSPHAMRLFDGGKRRAWPGAREAIEKDNREVEQAAQEWQEKQSSVEVPGR